MIKLEDYERTTRPELVDSYEKGGFCWVVTGSTQFGRAYADPQEVPDALRYYDELRRRGEVVFRIGSEPAVLVRLLVQLLPAEPTTGPGRRS